MRSSDCRSHVTAHSTKNESDSSQQWFDTSIVHSQNTLTAGLETETKITIIAITRLCNIQQYFTAFKKNNFQMKNCDVLFIFAQNIDCEAVLPSTHNLCFRAKIRKNVYPSCTI